MDRTEVFLVYEARDEAGYSSSDDRMMWRLLLARLHPDAGGDQDLFAFASAVRDEMARGKDPVRDTGGEDRTRSAEAAAPFLRTWQDAMGLWSSGNRDTLNNVWSR
jgi:hypothetical protein